MNFFSKKSIKNLLKNYDIALSKRLGQNFLISEQVLKKIIETANLSKDDIVLEIGPGIGNLTLELAKKVKKVIAIEKDPKMYQILKDLLKDRNIKNIKIINADVLKIGNYKLFKNLKFKTEIPKEAKVKKRIKSSLPIKNSYKIVANLPYYITSPLIRKFLESNPPAGGPPKEMILMVQKEVAQRICAKPPDMNLLAVSVQFYAKPEIIFYVSKKSFWPIPKVDSAIIKISNIKNQKSKIDNELFFRVVRAGFSQPRKQLVNNLSRVLKYDKKKVEVWLLKNNIRPEQRAETLTLKDWLKLSSG